jgi:membrane protease YdiL (CAAX protease family)
MNYDDHNPSGAAPARARSTDAPESMDLPTMPPPMEPDLLPPSDLPRYPPLPEFRAGLSDDLRVPWGWTDVALFVILGVIGSWVVTWGLAEASIKFFGVNADAVFGDSMSTAKSVVLLAGQALIDAGAILYLYLMLVARTPEPFWRAIGWRGMPPPVAPFRASAVQYLTGGAVMALVITLAGSFLNSKETLPIEQLLQARVSMLLFSVLGVLVAPLVEETIFRGFLYPVIARRVGIAAGVGITGVLFGLTHAAQLWGGWGQIVLLIVVGLVLTYVRARTGTVTASYFVHLGYNGLQLVGYVFYVLGSQHLH